MGEFFHGWRRKIGCVMLMLACVFMGGWVRSFEYDDTVGFFDVIHQRDYYLQSANGRLLWYCQEPDGEPRAVQFPYCGWMTEPLLDVPPTHFIRADRSIVAFRWGFQWFKLGGEEFLSVEPTNLSGGIQLFIPYWSIAVPLTLISAFLLLTKPRQSTQKKITEPAPNEGT